ncbi:uncharacterized protein V1516DRAFT_681774 [Lipomyces oligophaga]|uniref:uncharacterized protein n=1 Tax=Lipomyces oligophaga TaxID=45792 RepID=UPI0034CD7A27
MNSYPKTFADLPSYQDLPNKQQYWPYPKGSARESEGMVGLLTPEHIAQCAASEIRTGERVNLEMPVQEVAVPFFNRKGAQVDIHYNPFPVAFDDEIYFNPQAGSQWDGFRHHSQPLTLTAGVTPAHKTALPENEQYVWYGGTKGSEIAFPGSDRLGIGYLAQKGIIGRGVLLDYARWAEEQGIQYSCFERHAIPVAHLKQIVTDYQIELRYGDILCIRSGTTMQLRKLSIPLPDINSSEPRAIGVEQSDELFEWIWNNHFCGLVGDALAFEAFPSPSETLSLHFTCLAGWGIPIGELFDLEALAVKCHELRRYSFFFVSIPINVIGGVSSPPNAVAIF